MLTENANAAMQPKDTSAINKNRKKRGRNPTALFACAPGGTGELLDLRGVRIREMES